MKAVDKIPGYWRDAIIWIKIDEVYKIKLSKCGHYLLAYTKYPSTKITQHEVYLFYQGKMICDENKNVVDPKHWNFYVSEYSKLNILNGVIKSSTPTINQNSPWAGFHIQPSKGIHHTVAKGYIFKNVS